MGKKKYKTRYIDEACRDCLYWDKTLKSCLNMEPCLFRIDNQDEKKRLKKMRKALEELKKNDPCTDCPYGMYSPCIGYCTKMILDEECEFDI